MSLKNQQKQPSQRRSKQQIWWLLALPGKEKQRPTMLRNDRTKRAKQARKVNKIRSCPLPLHLKSFGPSMKVDAGQQQENIFKSKTVFMLKMVEKQEERPWQRLWLPVDRTTVPVNRTTVRINPSKEQENSAELHDLHKARKQQCLPKKRRPPGKKPPPPPLPPPPTTIRNQST